MPMRLWPFDLTENAEIPKLLLTELINDIVDEADIKNIKRIRPECGKSNNYKIEDGTLVPINENFKEKYSWQYPLDSRAVCLESFELATSSFEVCIKTQFQLSNQPHHGEISHRSKAMHWRFTKKGMMDNLNKKVDDSKKEKDLRDKKITTGLEKGYYPGSEDYESRNNKFMKAKNDYELNLKKKNQFDAENKKNPEHWKEEGNPWNGRWMSGDDIGEFPGIVEEYIQKLCPHHVQFLEWRRY